MAGLDLKIDYTRYYRKWHSEAPEHRAAMAALYRRLLTPHLPEKKDAKVLDVGCGMGFTMLTLIELGFRSVSGVDSDEGQVASCRDKGLSVERTDDTIAYLMSRRSEFDLILALDVIEHIPIVSQLAFVHSLCEALAPGGRLICSVPNANSAVAERWRYNDWTHHCSFTEHSLDFLLYNGSFREIRVQPMELLQKPAFVWLPISGARHWWAFRFFRSWRRLQMMAELGPAQGRQVPLSLNLLAIADRA